MTPALHLFLDGEPVGRIEPGRFGARAWLLGVAAVQVTVEDGRPSARLRAHVTGGGAARTWPLAARAVVHVAFTDGEPPPLPAIAPPPLDGATARLALFLDGELVETAPLDRAALAARAFGHVFCRWLREGGCEPGCDLTGFAAPPPGEKYRRLAARPLTVGAVVSYGYAALAHPLPRPIS